MVEGAPRSTKDLVEGTMREPQEQVVSWEGDMRVPENIQVDGVEFGVGYMRDGHIQLLRKDGTSVEAMYERVLDQHSAGEGDKVNSIRIKYDASEIRGEEGA